MSQAISRADFDAIRAGRHASYEAYVASTLPAKRTAVVRAVTDPGHLHLRVPPDYPNARAIRRHGYAYKVCAVLLACVATLPYLDLPIPLAPVNTAGTIATVLLALLLLRSTLATARLHASLAKAKSLNV